MYMNIGREEFIRRAAAGRALQAAARAKRACDHTDGPAHNCAYVDARNALIPTALRAADFMGEMDRLATATGLVSRPAWFQGAKAAAEGEAQRARQRGGRMRSGFYFRQAVAS